MRWNRSWNCNDQWWDGCCGCLRDGVPFYSCSGPLTCGRTVAVGVFILKVGRCACRIARTKEEAATVGFGFNPEMGFSVGFRVRV